MALVITERLTYEPAYCWAHFCQMVYYGHADWPSFSYWIVPGTERP